MSSSFRLPAGQQQFKQSLTFEDTVREQVRKCLEAMSLNDRQATAAAVRGLMHLVTPKMSDTTYLEQMEDLDEDWKKDMRLDQREYERRRREADGGCPDLVKKPSIFPKQQYWEDAFDICLALLERRGLLMKYTVQDDLS